MIFNLLITSLICLFSFSSVHNSYDHQLKEEKQVQNLGYTDTTGIQLYMFTSDFMSNEFLFTFIRQLSRVSAYSNVSQFVNANSYIELSTTGQIHLVDNYRVGNPVLDVNKIVINKIHHGRGETQYGDAYNYFTYTIYFNQNDDIRLYYTYLVSVPVFTTDSQDSDEISQYCSIYTTQTSNMQYQFWCYKENTLRGATPLISYYYYYINDESNNLDYDTIYQSGFLAGKDEGYTNGYANGRQSGLQEGYNQGVQYAQSESATALTIFQGIISVGLLPVNVFLAMMNFEVFGINIGGFVSSLLTIAIVVIIIRILLGTGGGKSD